MKVTLPPLSEQPDEELSNEMSTLSPEVAVALGVNDPRALPAEGAEPGEMVLVLVPAAEAAPALSNTRPATSAEAAANEVTLANGECAMGDFLARWERRVISLPAFVDHWRTASSEGCWVLTS